MPLTDDQHHATVASHEPLAPTVVVTYIFVPDNPMGIACTNVSAGRLLQLHEPTPKENPQQGLACPHPTRSW